MKTGTIVQPTKDHKVHPYVIKEAYQIRLALRNHKNLSSSAVSYSMRHNSNSILHSS